MEKMELQKAKEDHWKAKEDAHIEREEEFRNMEHLLEAQWEARRWSQRRRRRRVQGTQPPLQWMGVHSTEYMTTE